MIKVGIVGFGNLGRGVLKALEHNKDFMLVSVFTRRNKDDLQKEIPNVKCESYDDILNYKNEIDVLLLCGGSKSDLPVQTPYLARHFNVVDSYDNHQMINEHYHKVNKESVLGNKTSVISVGWDPGLFSIMRVLFESVLPQASTYTFWGKGVSQGHSDAIRRIKGVKHAVQYTIPKEDALNKVRNLENPKLETKDKHLRDCYVVLHEDASMEYVKDSIVNMPAYFKDYDTSVNFITEEEYEKNHKTMPHGGLVLRSGKTSDENNQLLEFKLNLDSNPEFTASVMISYARACYRLNKDNKSGCFTCFDIPLGLLINKESNSLREELL